MADLTKIKVNGVDYNIKDPNALRDAPIDGKQYARKDGEWTEVQGGSGITPEVKAALLNCFAHVGWADEHGQDYYDALAEALGMVKHLVSISAVFTQGTTVVYPSTSLDSLKTMLVVTALYDDDTTETVDDYTLSGELAVGTSAVTVTYSGKTTTFDVTVTAAPVLSGITAVYTQGATVVYPSASLDSLRANLVVTAVYSDSSTTVVNDYTLSGTLTEGTSTITATYNNKTATFSVNVTAEPIIPVLDHISAVYSGGEVTEGTAVDTLKANLVVTAHYTDETTHTVASTDYTLSGTIAVGSNTITVSYEDKTTTFTVIGKAQGRIPGYQEVEYISSSGTQYIDTGYTPNSNTVVEVKATKHDGNSVCGCDYNGTGKGVNITGLDKLQLFVNWADNAAVVTITETPHTYVVSSANYTLDGEMYNYKTDRPDATFASSLFLFARCKTSAANDISISDIYSFKISEGGTVLHELVPCYRISDNVIGMYDLATNTFYTNSGTGTFGKGADV